MARIVSYDKKTCKGHHFFFRYRRCFSICSFVPAPISYNVIKFVLKVFITFLKLIFLQEDGVMNVNRVERINQRWLDYFDVTA